VPVESTRTYLPMKMEQTERSETSAYKIQTPGNYPKESKQLSVHGESLKSRIIGTYSSTHIISSLFIFCRDSFYKPISKWSVPPCLRARVMDTL